MGAFLEAFFSAIGQMLAELGLSKRKKTPKSKQMSFKETCLMLITVGIFFGLFNLFLSLFFNFIKGFFE